MDFIKKLEQLGLLNKGNALDVGAGKLNEAKKLAEKGYIVDAVDINESDVIDPSIHFYKSKIEDFNTEKKYSLIIAQNVLFFTNDPLTNLVKLFNLTEKGGYVCFTLLGKKMIGIRIKTLFVSSKMI